MNTIDDSTFVVRLTPNSDAQTDPHTNRAEYKLKCRDWVYLVGGGYDVALVEASIPIESVDLCDGGDGYYVEVNRQTGEGIEQTVRCNFSNVVATSPELFVKAVRVQMQSCRELLAMFGDDPKAVPFINYGSTTQRISIHFLDNTADLARPSLLRFSYKLCSKLGIDTHDQPFAAANVGQIGLRQPIVGHGRNALAVYKSHEFIHVSLPGLVDRGLLMGSGGWTSIVGTVQAQRHRQRPAVGFTDEYHQTKQTFTNLNPNYFHCNPNEIMHFRVDLLLDNLSCVVWAFPNVDFAMSVKFRRTPKLGFLSTSQ